MNNQELRQLCERVLADDPKMTVHPVRLADACLRLIAENEAMRGVVDAAKEAAYHLDCVTSSLTGKHITGCEKCQLYEALSKLESP